jgi:hypothetical protein
MSEMPDNKITKAIYCLKSYKPCALCKLEKPTKEVIYKIYDFARRAETVRFCDNCMAKMLTYAFLKLQDAQMQPIFETEEIDSRTSDAVKRFWNESPVRYL